MLDMNIEGSSNQEPPSFLVGCDERNCWVAVEVHGLSGGLFTDRDAALKFVWEETGGRTGAVRMVERLSPFGMQR
jgi:hypothetical protein